MSLSKEKLQPVIKNSGFSMEGYYIWCGSAIKGEDGKYYLFASRWPESKSFPEGYMSDSEIVLATTDDLDKPFKFEKVIISKREDKYWDSIMAHNPMITKIGDEYVLFYISTTDGSGEERCIGYATSKRLADGWVRADKPINLPKNANNPCCIEKNGEILMYFRDGALKVSVAKAEKYDGDYKVLKTDLFPKGMIEDMFVYKENGKFIMIAEDAEGAYTGIVKAGVKFESDDGIDWTLAENPSVYDFNIEYQDGEKITLQRRERPMILFEKEYDYLFTTAKIGGEENLTVGHTWNLVQKVKK